MASTHTWGGVNYADAFNTAMTMAGIGLLSLGAAMFVNWSGLLAAFCRPAAAQARPD
jgi:hypothetical protein